MSAKGQAYFQIWYFINFRLTLLLQVCFKLNNIRKIRKGTYNVHLLHTPPLPPTYLTTEEDSFYMVKVSNSLIHIIYTSYIWKCLDIFFFAWSYFYGHRFNVQSLTNVFVPNKVCYKRGYLLLCLDKRQCIYTLIYLVTPSLSWYSWVIKWNVTPVALISENNKAGILNTLFKVKLVVLVKQLLRLLKRNFSNAFFSGVKIPDICSFEFMLGAGSGKLYSEGFVSNTRKTSQDQKKTIPCAQQAGLCALQF